MRGQKREQTALGHQVPDQRGGVEKLPIGTLYTLHPEILSPLYKQVQKTRPLFSALLERKAAEFGWQFVPVAEDFAGRGYCAGSRSMFVNAETSCKTQGDFDGTMHPNARGHAAFGLRLREAL